MSIADYVLPFVIFAIITVGFVKRVPLFDVFLQGAKEGMFAAYKIAPSITGLVVAVQMLTASGFFDMIAAFVKPIANFCGFPVDVLPLVLLRPVSGSGSLALLDNILTLKGADSFAGRVASVMMGSTETTFYAITVYFGAAGIKHIRHTAVAAVLADITGAVCAAVTVTLFFS